MDRERREIHKVRNFSTLWPRQGVSVVGKIPTITEEEAKSAYNRLKDRIQAKKAKSTD